MTAHELLQTQMKDVGIQLGNAFKGITDDGIDDKPVEGAMSPREQVAHLAECYIAVVTQLGGGKHEWGTYTPKATSWGPLVEEMQGLRAKAVAGILASDSDDALKTGSAFVVGHDNYHIGQLCMCRMDAEPSWDAYSIYEGLM